LFNKRDIIAIDWRRINKARLSGTEVTEGRETGKSPAISNRERKRERERERGEKRRKFGKSDETR